MKFKRKKEFHKPRLQKRGPSLRSSLWNLFQKNVLVVSLIKMLMMSLRNVLKHFTSSGPRQAVVIKKISLLNLNLLKSAWGRPSKMAARKDFATDC